MAGRGLPDIEAHYAQFKGKVPETLRAAASPRRTPRRQPLTTWRLEQLAAVLSRAGRTTWPGERGGPERVRRAIDAVTCVDAIARPGTQCRGGRAIDGRHGTRSSRQRASQRLEPTTRGAGSPARSMDTRPLGSRTSDGARRVSIPADVEGSRITRAYLLIQTEPGKAERSTREIRSHPGVSRAEAVTGSWDDHHRGSMPATGGSTSSARSSSTTFSASKESPER